MVVPSGSLKVMLRMPVPVWCDEETTLGGMPSMIVMCWSGAADMPLPATSVTAPIPMSSCGAAIPLTVVLWAVESVTVNTVDEDSRVLLATASRARPPEDRPVSRTAMRS